MSQKKLHDREVATAYYGKRAFSIAAPTLWNNIPIAIRNAISIDIFNLRHTYLITLLCNTFLDF